MRVTWWVKSRSHNTSSKPLFRNFPPSPATATRRLSTVRVAPSTTVPHLADLAPDERRHRRDREPPRYTPATTAPIVHGVRFQRAAVRKVGQSWAGVGVGVGLSSGPRAGRRVRVRMAGAPVRATTAARTAGMIKAVGRDEASAT